VLVLVSQLAQAQFNPYSGWEAAVTFCSAVFLLTETKG
jgi:hypothetical protein